MSETAILGSADRALNLLVNAARVSPHLRDAVAEVEAEMNALRAECQRHRRANLVRAVIDGWDEATDGSLTDYVNEQGWDPVPWKVAQDFIDRAKNGSDPKDAA